MAGGVSPHTRQNQQMRMLESTYQKSSQVKKVILCGSHSAVSLSLSFSRVVSSVWVWRHYCLIGRNDGRLVRLSRDPMSLLIVIVFLTLSRV